MTEAARRPRRPRWAPIVWGSIALFAVLFTLLTYQLSAKAAGGESRRVVVRKVIAKRVVKTIVPAEPAESEATAGGVAPEVVEEAPAEVEAPEPAPVVTATS